MARALGVCAALGLLAVGCGEPERQVQQWSPDDHQAVEQTQTEPTQAPSEQLTPEQVARMTAEVWSRECATCHGPSGRGDGPSAPTAMPDFTTAAFHDAREDADLTRAIRMGQGLMPAYGGRFADAGIQALVAHVRSLRAQHP